MFTFLLLTEVHPLKPYLELIRKRIIDQHCSNALPYHDPFTSRDSLQRFYDLLMAGIKTVLSDELVVCLPIGYGNVQEV